jgi:hypothetical protein
MSFIRALCIATSALFAATGPARAQRAAEPMEIAPPFSLNWHEPSERVEGKIDAAKLNVVERRKIGGRWAMTVTGFKKPNGKDVAPPELRRVVFVFSQGQLSKDKDGSGKVRERISGGQLSEVELQYEHEGWTEEQYAACISEKRQILERIHGPGQQIVRSSAPTPDGKATQTLVGYKWNKNNTAVQLLYFNATAKEGGSVFHTLSLHYKRS